jgi:DNA polymerase-3 subunit epsilon
MKVLVFDTETTGLPAGYNSPLTDLSKWPYVVQLSFIVFDTLKKEILDYTDHIIKLDPDVLITPESVAIHQITMERSQMSGIPIKQALREFNAVMQDVDLVVGHNIQFDKNLLTVEFKRNKIKNSLYRDGRPVNEFCTMKQTVELCKLPFANSTMLHYKWPTLSELHTCLFSASPRGTHNAIADVMICLRCYVYLQHKYDIAFDEEVKIVFRVLYAAYCLGGSAHQQSKPQNPPSNISLGGSARQQSKPPTNIERKPSIKASSTIYNVIKDPIYIDTEDAPPPLPPKVHVQQVHVQQAHVQQEQPYYVEHKPAINEPSYTQYQSTTYTYGE